MPGAASLEGLWAKIADLQRPLIALKWLNSANPSEPRLSVFESAGKELGLIFWASCQHLREHRQDVFWKRASGCSFQWQEVGLPPNLTWKTIQMWLVVPINHPHGSTDDWRGYVPSFGLMVCSLTTCPFSHSLDSQACCCSQVMKLMRLHGNLLSVRGEKELEGKPGTLCSFAFHRVGPFQRRHSSHSSNLFWAPTVCQGLLYGNARTNAARCCLCAAQEVPGFSLKLPVLIHPAPRTAALLPLHPPGSKAARSTWEVGWQFFLLAGMWWRCFFLTYIWKWNFCISLIFIPSHSKWIYKNYRS